MRTKVQNSKGVSLYLAIMVLSILLTIFLGLASLIVVQIKLARKMEGSVMAFYAADTGIERTLYDFECSYPQGSGTTLANGAFYEVGVDCEIGFSGCPCAPDPDCSAPRMCIRSTGEFEGARRTIEVRY